ncbi:MAG: hypothetical protein KTR30_25320 [Saprospiraceae bacterium]|nr:hypothetical protein [Saprospiraceae bacterium]
MSTGTIYKIETTAERDKLDVNELASTQLQAEYTSMTILKVNGTAYLLGYIKEIGTTDMYKISEGAPYFDFTKSQLDLGKEWDIVEPFYMANKPHLMCYQSKNGHMYFFPISNKLSSEHPLHFYHTRYPYTTDLYEVKPLVSQGQVFVIGYNQTNGYVNIWTVSATSNSSGDSPPLQVEVIWAHQWAKGWTRFAFFTWGNENFFLKTNTWKPNVNIDHVWDDLSKGTNEVGSHLKLKDDQILNIVRPFEVGPGDPYFLTYLEKTGESNFNKVHGDCLGWTTCATENSVKGAKHIVPYRIGEINYALYVS